MTSEYVLDTGLGVNIKHTNQNEESVEIKGGKVTMKDSLTYGETLICYGTQFNPWAVVFYLCLLAFIGCTIIVLAKLGIFKKLINFIKQKKAEADAKKPMITVDASAIREIPAEPIETTATNEPSLFCENCGAKRDADALVCTECGTRFED